MMSPLLVILSSHSSFSLKSHSSEDKEGGGNFYCDTGALEGERERDDETERDSSKMEK